MLNRPRGPDVIASTSARCSPVRLAAASAGRRGNGDRGLRDRGDDDFFGMDSSVPDFMAPLAM